MDGSGNNPLLICYVCLDFFNGTDRIPKCLDCLHNVCLRCTTLMYTTLKGCITCPICLTTYEKSPQEMETDFELLETVKLVQILPHRDHFWCLKCGVVPEASCFTHHQVILPRDEEEKATIQNFTFCATNISLKTSIAEMEVLEQEWDLLVSKIQSVAESWKSRLSEEKGRFSSLCDSLSRLCFNESGTVQFSTCTAAIKHLKKEESTLTGTFDSDIALCALQILHNSTAESEDMIGQGQPSRQNSVDDGRSFSQSVKCKASEKLMDQALEKNDWEGIESLIQAGIPFSPQLSNGSTLLHLAVQQGNQRITDLLLKSKTVQVNAREGNGRTALHYAASGGHTTLARYLLFAGAIVNCQDNDGVAPLHLAVREGHVSCVGLLLDYGANALIQDNSGTSPYSWSLEKGKKELLDILV